MTSAIAKLNSVLRRIQIRRASGVVLGARVSICVWIMGALLVGSGCGRKPAEQQSPASVVAATVTNQAPPAAGTAAQPAPNLLQADGQVDVPELQRSVLRWVLAHQRRPKNFEEFAATAGFKIPDPPAGKKYELSKDMHVTLVNR